MIVIDMGAIPAKVGEAEAARNAAVSCITSKWRRWRLFCPDLKMLARDCRTRTIVDNKSIEESGLEYPPHTKRRQRSAMNSIVL